MDIDTSLDVELNNVGLMSEFLETVVDDVDAAYVVPMLAGKFVFEIKDSKAAMTEITNYETKEKVARPQVAFSLEVAEVVAIAPGQKDVPENINDLVGKRLVERITWTGNEDEKSKKTFLGYVKAFLVDAMGKPFSGNYSELLEAAIGTRFQAEVRLQKGRKDDPTMYPRLQRGMKGAIIPAM